MMKKPVSVIGAGSWGTAIANLLAKKGYPVYLWVYEPELMEIIAEKRENTMYLPGVQLPENLIASTSLEEVLSPSEFVVWVTPSHTVRATLSRALPHLRDEMIFVGASKGIENNTLLRVSEIVKDVVKDQVDLNYLTLSGPTFAREVAMDHPTTAVVAGSHEDSLRRAQETFNTRVFRVYINTDHVGVELGGALKNVIAIAAGISAGLDLGSNTRAALITRGLWEISRFGRSRGADPLTFLGLAGMGDLVLTCDGTESRNFKVGYRIGRGDSLQQIQDSMRMVAEGVKTTHSVWELARKYDVEMPITEQVYQVIYHNKCPRTAIRDLMSRSLKSEHQMD